MLAAQSCWRRINLLLRFRAARWSYVSADEIRLTIDYNRHCGRYERGHGAADI
jgi:hypothetical protein